MPSRQAQGRVMSKPTIALAMIVRDGGKKFRDTLASAAPHVDEIIIALDTRTKDNSANIARKFKAKVYPFDWKTDDFAAARNYSFSKVTSKFVLWLDGDDVLENGHRLREIIESLEPDVSGVWLPYLYAFDEYGNCTTLLDRERILRTSVEWRWEGRLHEVVVPPGPVKWARDEQTMVIHRGAEGTKTARNLPILLDWMKDEPDNIRIKMFLGNQYFAEGDWRKAVRWYTEFWTDGRCNWYDKFQSATYAARAWREIGNLPEANRADMAAAVTCPQWADAWIGLAENALLAGDFDKSLTYAEIAAQRQPADRIVMVNPLDYTVRLENIFTKALAERGRFEEAHEHCQKALQVRADDKNVLANLEALEREIAAQRHTEAFSLLTRGADTDEILQVAGSLKDGLLGRKEVRDIMIPAMLAKTKRGTQPTCIISCGPSLEKWADPTPETKGIGGSETAVVEMSRRLSREGWRVLVYNDCGALEGPHGGVMYVDWERFRPGDAKGAELFISWRNPLALQSRDIGKARQTWLWCHDLNYGDSLTPKIAANLDTVMAVSGWHRDYLEMCYPFLKACPEQGRRGKVGVLPNGVNPSRFSGQGKVEKVAFKCVYSSSPDRGLVQLLQMWPAMKAIEPAAQLHIFYGWENIDKAIAMGHHDLIALKTYVQKLIGSLKDVHWRGRLSQTELAREFMEADLWLYPTHFLETFCCVGDTLIDMPRDYSKYPKGVPIRDLVGKKGFPVWCYNEETGQFQLAPVKGVGKTGLNKEVWRLTFDDGTYLRATPDHPVLTYKRGWVQLQDLQPGESVVHLKKHTMVQVSVGRGAWPHEHRLVAEWTLGPIPKGYHVDHLDGNSLNNNPENLQYLSPSEHAKKTFTGQFVPPKVAAARLQGWRKWYEEDVEGRRALHQRLHAMGSKLWERVNALPPEERAAWLAKRATAKRASTKIKEDALSDEERAVLRAAYRERGKKGAAARYNHKVASVAFDCYEDVYNMEVDGPHNYVANGVVIHNCITAVESLMAECIPVTSNLGPLPEVIGDAGLLVPGDSRGGQYQSIYEDAFAQGMADVYTRALIRSRMRGRAAIWTWDKAFEALKAQIKQPVEV